MKRLDRLIAHALASGSHSSPRGRTDDPVRLHAGDKGTADAATAQVAGHARVYETHAHPRLLDVRQAAAYLSISHWTVRDMAWRGELPEVRLGRRLLFDVRDLDLLVERNKHNRERV